MMPVADHARPIWYGPVSCVVGVLGLAAFFATTTFSFDLRVAGSDHSSFGFNFASGMSLWYHVGLVVAFVVGFVVAVLGIRRASRLRVVAWLGLVANAIAAAFLTLFLVLAAMQGGFR